MSNEIQLYDKFQNPLEAITRLGEMFAKSGMANCDKTEQGQVLAWACFCEKKSPFEILRTYHLLPGGRLTKKGMSIYAEFLALGGKLKWILTGEEIPKSEDERAAKAELTFNGQTITYSYSIGDAKLEGLYDKKGSRYKTAPGEMLRSKVQTKGIPLLAPMLVAGGDDSNVDDTSITPQLTLAEKIATVVSSVKDEVKIESPKSTMSPTMAAIIGDEKELAAAGLAPETKVETAKPQQNVAANPAATSFVATEFGGKLTQETAFELAKRISPHEEKVGAWLAQRQWIVDGDIRTLSLKRAQQIIDFTENFLTQAVGIGK